MRLRFFLVILLSTLFTAALVTFIQLSIVSSERLRLIDAQIRESATILVNSELADLKKIDFDEAEGLISDELGPSRIGKVFIIRNAQNQIVFQSNSASVLDIDIPRSPQWITLQNEQFFLRILNLELPKIPDRTLQIGYVLDPNFLSWSILIRRGIGYSSMVVSLAIIISIGLTLVLLSPFRRLIHYINEVTQDLERLNEIKTMPATLRYFSEGPLSNKDEFSKLLKVFKTLTERINSNQQFFRLWSVRLAHELKTPLTVIRTQLESKNEGRKWDSLIYEIDSMAKILSEFLNWSELEHKASTTDKRVFSVSERTQELIQHLPQDQRDRIRLEVQSNSKTIANPIHFEQVVNNLIHNALKYSPKDSSVFVQITHRYLSVTDEGPGLPSTTQQKLGQPFNKGPNSTSTSTGLGIAIAISIAKHYSWKLTFEKATSQKGTQAVLHFKNTTQGLKESS